MGEGIYKLLNDIAVHELLDVLSITSKARHSSGGALKRFRGDSIRKLIDDGFAATGGNDVTAAVSVHGQTSEKRQRTFKNSSRRTTFVEDRNELVNRVTSYTREEFPSQSSDALVVSKGV